MAKEWAKAFYKSTGWKRCRTAFIAQREGIDGGLCQECGERLGYIVHHRQWLTPQNVNDPGITLDKNNLEYVCQECHNRIEQQSKRYEFDEAGQPRPPHAPGREHF